MRRLLVFAVTATLAALTGLGVEPSGDAAAATKPTILKIRPAIDPAIVRQLYQRIYGRPAEGEEFQNWARALSSCVEQKSAQQPLAGGGVAKALESCLSSMGVDPSAGGLGGVMTEDGLDRGLGYSLSIGCTSGANVDPRLATRPPTADEKEMYGLDSTQKMYTDEERAQIAKELMEAHREAAETFRETPEYKEWSELNKEAMEHPDDKALQEKADAALNTAMETKEGQQFEKTQKAVQEGPPVATPPLVSHTDPNAPNACDGILAELAECEQVGWITGNCQILKAKLQGCSDPTITDPAPDGEACPTQEVDEAVALAAVDLLCRTLRDPPPGEDPCGGATELGEPVRIGLKPCSEIEGYPEVQAGVLCADVCTSPEAMPGEDQCLATLGELPTLGRSVEEVVALGRKIFGGPVIDLPNTGNGPLGPGPKY